MKYMAHSCCSVCMKHSLYKSIRWLLFNDGASEDHWCFSTVSLERHYCRNCRRRETKQSACWGSVMMGGSALGVMEAMFWSYTLLLLLLCVCVCVFETTHRRRLCFQNKSVCRAGCVFYISAGRGQEWVFVGQQFTQNHVKYVWPLKFTSKTTTLEPVAHSSKCS